MLYDWWTETEMSEDTDLTNYYSKCVFTGLIERPEFRFVMIFSKPIKSNIPQVLSVYKEAGLSDDLWSVRTITRSNLVTTNPINNAEKTDEIKNFIIPFLNQVLNFSDWKI